MAKLRNTFLKSKMNKDLDSRLVPTGEYRDALNITVGKSESASVGTAQNVLGNSSIGTPGFKGVGVLKCIGYVKDDSRNIVILFQTTYEDPSETQITQAPLVETCKIALIDFSGTAPVEHTLVQGSWLNLATNNQYSITGVNLVEDLLFWTDNRNQPRKINITTALSNSNYYKYEHQISVAKYAPIEPIQLFKKVEARTTASGTNVSVITLDSTAGIEVGMFVISNVIPVISGEEYVQVVEVNNATTVTVDNGNALFNGVTFLSGQDLLFLSSTMTDESDRVDWPGDPDYLESRYVRFSYRIRYDDNEYSTFAPFTQICFIPKQKGYLINGDEKNAFRSTILDWFENNVNSIELLIPLPATGNKLISDYSISEIDILYKESESLVVSVLETVEVSTIQSSIPDTNIFNYTYDSSKPYKTLPEAQTTRVYDKVPVRARAQEVSGNRVIYANYRDAWTTPSSVDYNVAVQEKTSQFTNFIEYPNHTLKQNRNYQVGFIFADKYNRQSSVVLSSNDTGTSTSSIFFGTSTVYSPYTVEGLDVKSWFGNALRVLVNSPISSTNNTLAGTPGLYANPISTGLGFAITDTVTITSTTYTFTLDNTVPSQNEIPTVDSYLRGQFTDYVKVTNVVPVVGFITWVVTTEGQVNDIYRFDQVNASAPNTKFAYNINPIGWYSYKVVVKQQEQQYYNSYLPGMLNAYPADQTSDSSVKYIQSATGRTNAGTSSSIITLTDSFTLEDLIIGMTATNVTTAFSNGTPVIVTDISGLGSGGTVTVTVNQPVTYANLDTILFTATQALIEHGVNTTSFPVDEDNKTAHVVLINDNINKIPRDLQEVGPDQKQYRSSVELFGRVENFGQTDLIASGNTINPPAVSIKTNEFTYDATTVDGQLIAVYKAGDSLQAENGGPATGQQAYPSGWIKDTVIVSNTIDSATNIGTIIFSPSQILYGVGAGNPTDSFSFLREENRQYFPERKADTVNTISTARDLDFLPNSIDNIRGTAALNFYQLDTNPLVARISTVKGIGAFAAEMSPFLSVYETKPVESQLDIFWETATTGYISDLNLDVLTGFDGAVNFTATNYNHKENQDASGVGTVTGAADSKYITDNFFARDLQGNQISNATMQLVEVKDLDGVDRTSDFGIEAQAIPGAYRLIIQPGASFVFNRNANTAENYEFTIEVEPAGLPPVELPTFGRLQNIKPEIVNGCSFYDSQTTQAGENLPTIEAINGSFDLNRNTENIFFEIIPGAGTQYFQIDQNGEISLDPSAGIIPIGFYSLDIKVTDAFSGGSALINTGQPNFSSKEDSCAVANVGITVGQEEVPPGFESTNILRGVINFLGSYGVSQGSSEFNRTQDPDNDETQKFDRDDGNPYVIETGGSTGGAKVTVSTKITRPTFPSGSGSSPSSTENVKYACLYMGPHKVNIDTDFNNLSSTTYGTNTETGVGGAALPGDGTGSLGISFIDTAAQLGFASAGPYMAGENLEISNGVIDPVGLISGQLEVSNAVTGNGTWLSFGPLWDREVANGQTNLYYKIFYRAATIAQDGQITYAGNNHNNWVQVSDINGSVSNMGWTNAAGGTDNANNPLSTKVFIANDTYQQAVNPQCGFSSSCLPRTAKRTDTFVLDGTKFPGEYCIVYKLEASGGEKASGQLSSGFDDQPYYPASELFPATLEISTTDYNFASGNLKYPPGAPAEYVVNPSLLVGSAESVGYAQQSNSQDVNDVSYVNQTYNTASTFAPLSQDIILTSSPVSPYLRISGPGIDPANGGTYISAVNVDGDPNKITLSQPTIGAITPADDLTIGRTFTPIEVPFSVTNGGVIVYSTQGTSNNVNQFFTDINCTVPYGISDDDGSTNLFKLYNQRYNALNPAKIDYQDPLINPDVVNNPIMPPVSNRPFASAKISGGGYITDSNTSNGDRDVSPIKQTLGP